MDMSIQGPHLSRRASWLDRALHFDWILLFATMGTVVVGILMVHSAEGPIGSGYLTRQLVGSLVGFVGLGLLTILPYQIFRMYVRPMYIFMIVVLIAVLIPGIGSNLRGTRGWFHLGPVYIQSSEVAKFFFVLSLGGILDRRIQWYTPRSLFLPLGAALLPIVMIMTQPDLSSSLVFIPVTLVMFYVAGARTLHLAAISSVMAIAGFIPLLSTFLNLVGPGLKGHTTLLFLSRALKGGWEGIMLFVGVCIFLILAWWVLRILRFYIPSLFLWVTLALLAIGSLGAVAANHAIRDYQRKRLVAFVNPNLDPLGGGYNVRQSQIAVGSGRVLGKGYMKGTQSRLGFLPSRHTDFIFSVIGEELGFARSFLVLTLYFLIIWRGFEISLVSRDRYGSLVATGFSSMFAFYALLNIGMTMGMAPVAGVPLPLVSYGGSSVVSSMFGVGVLMSIHQGRHLLDKA